jgi:hypothetical protein
MINKEKEVKNLRLCLRIHIWSSVIIAVLWAAMVANIYLRWGTLKMIGWPYLIAWALVYYGLRVKLKKIESGGTNS